jgi:hypothetical protein
VTRAGGEPGRAPGGGWTIAKALLEHERELISQMRERAAAIEEPLESLARRYVGEDLADDPIRCCATGSRKRTWTTCAAS